LNSNQIKKLPKWICDFTKIKINWKKAKLRFLHKNSITLYDNPIENIPIEIIKQGKQAIQNYFEKIKKEGKKYLFESKVLIIGEGGAGKTSFALKIQDENAELLEDAATTLGIEVSNWNFDIQHQGQAEKMHVNLWDFGGQKYYRGTHQLFFSQKSFYVLLDDSRAEKMEHSYWLNTLEQLAGEQSKVLILTNKKHGHSKSLDENGLKGRFGKIIHDFVELDLKNDKKGIVSLRKDLQHILPKMEGMGDPVPSSWVKIREDLSQIKKNWISYDKYAEICKKYNSDISNKDITFMSDYFNRIGVFTHYYDDKTLKNRVFLDSNWLLSTVYEVLNHKLVKDKLGRIDEADLQKIWSEDEFSVQMEYLRPLMLRFGMMYEIEKEKKYIAPQHLKINQPYPTWEHEKSGEILQFAYEFDKYMPSGIMPRLIVALRDCITNHELVWQKGVNLSYENSHAEITETYDKTNKYLIRICGKKKKELLGIINREFGKILAPFQNLHYEKLVPCICGECKGSANPYFHKYSSLEKRKEKGKQSIECDRSYEDVNVMKLLEGVSVSEDKKKNAMNKDEKIKIFVSYSSEDRGLRKLLVKGINKYLANRKGFDYQIWDDTAIDLGANWKKVIKKALKESNVALLLVSASFASSQFINEHELTAFFKKHKKKGYLILPVLITDYEFSEFEKLSALNFFKTYNSEYGFNSPLERHELLSYNKLAEGNNTTDRLLNLYYKNLTDFIHTAVKNNFKK
jgi:GTPase SAR1 family protein